MSFIYVKASDFVLFIIGQINVGIEEIMAYYVHQEMTRKWIFGQDDIVSFKF